MFTHQQKIKKIEAVQWYSLGDHPMVVAFKTDPEAALEKCNSCGCRMAYHGWLSSPAIIKLVCPTDMIITTTYGYMVVHKEGFDKNWEALKC